MSSASLVEGPGGVYAAWETRGQVRFSRIEPGTVRHTAPVDAPGAAGGRKHPALAVNRDGQVLLAWTEGTGWQKGGSLAWQLYDRDGRPTGAPERVEGGVPVWGLLSAVALPDGSFLLFH